MSVHKKNGKYVPIVYMGKDPLTGKEIRKWGSYHEKKRDAEKEEAKMKLERKKPRTASIFRVATFESLVKQYLETVAPAKYSATTLEMYIGYYKKHTEQVFKGRMLKEIEPMHIQRFIQTKSELAPASQRKIFYFLKSIFDSAVKWQWLSFNPCIGTELPEIKKNRDKVIWSPEEVASFFKSEAVQESKYYVMLLVSFATGMRPGEVCGLKWMDVEEKYISVREGMDNKKRTTDLKTNSSFRKIYIDENLHEKLKQQRDWQLANKKLFGAEYNQSDFVFTHEDGSKIIPRRLGFAFKTLVSQSGIALPAISIYGARHSFASNAIAAGIEPSVVASILGHSTISTTYDNYVHVKSGPIKAASTAMYNTITQQ